MSVYGMIGHLNLTLFHYINGFSGNYKLDVVIIGIMHNLFIKELVLGAPYVFFWVKRGQKESDVTILSGVLSGCIAVLVARLLAVMLPFEYRPIFDASSGYKAFSVLFKPDIENWSAFPSDNAALVSGLTLGLFTINRYVSVFWFILSFIFILLPRLYSGLHYPWDIIVGVIIGIVSVIFVVSIKNFVNFFVCRLKFINMEIRFCVYYIVFVETVEMFDGIRPILKLFYSVMRGM